VNLLGLLRAETVQDLVNAAKERSSIDARILRKRYSEERATANRAILSMEDVLHDTMAYLAQRLGFDSVEDMDYFGSIQKYMNAKDQLSTLPLLLDLALFAEKAINKGRKEKDHIEVMRFDFERIVLPNDVVHCIKRAFHFIRENKD